MVNKQIVKGFSDYIGTDALKRARIRKIILKQFELYGFEPAETPTIEFEEFVKGNNVNDDAVSDIFKLEDRGKRKLALKYESTFQLKRIALNQKLPYKRYEICRVFRDEPVKSNRFREFTQCDADIVGASINDEAELLSMVSNILDKLGIKYVIYFNNRKLLNEILVSMNIEERNRESVIRELDKLDKVSKKDVADALKKLGAERILKIIDIGDFKKYGSYKEIEKLKKLARIYKINIKFLPTLARGLSYYNGTVFEIKTKDIKETICAGGAYKVGEIQSFGISFGFDRLAILASVGRDTTDIQIISIGKDIVAIELASKLRKGGISVNVLLDKTIGKAMDYANTKGIGKVVFVGEKEVKIGKFKVRDMKSGDESFLSIKEIIGIFKT